MQIVTFPGTGARALMTRSSTFYSKCKQKSLVGEYEIPDELQNGGSLALDEVNQVLYVGGDTSVYKFTR